MTAVYLDTVGLVATWDTSDQWHARGRRAYQELLIGRVPVVTTTFVLLECGNASARRPYRSAVTRFRHEMERTRRVIVPGDDDWSQAWDAYSRGEAADAGIVDHVSFVVMRRLGITDVFSNDRHFQAAGFNTLF
jgi:predicted nucleic acid-binding protein